MDKRLGVIIMLSYASFLVLSILVETNVFFPVNLPTCIVNWSTCTDIYTALSCLSQESSNNYRVQLSLTAGLDGGPGTIILLQSLLSFMVKTKIRYVYIWWSTKKTYQTNTYTHTHTVLQPIQSDLYIYNVLNVCDVKKNGTVLLIALTQRPLLRFLVNLIHTHTHNLNKNVPIYFWLNLFYIFENCIYYIIVYWTIYMKPCMPLIRYWLVLIIFFRHAHTKYRKFYFSVLLVWVVEGSLKTRCKYY